MAWCPDSHDNHVVGKRLADLEMQVGEERDAAGEAAPYQAAIALYEELLEQPDAEDLDQIIYQLARAYDVVGDNASAKRYLDRLIAEYPTSEHVVEARFRRAEMAFSAEQYATAAEDYEFCRCQRLGDAVLAERELHARLVPLQGIAARPRLESFFVVVDSIIADDAEPDRGSKELLDDALRVIVLAVSYLDGANTLADHMQKLEPARVAAPGLRASGGRPARAKALSGQRCDAGDVHRQQQARSPCAGVQQAHHRYVDRRRFPERDPRRAKRTS